MTIEQLEPALAYLRQIGYKAKLELLSAKTEGYFATTKRETNPFEVKDGYRPDCVSISIDFEDSGSGDVLKAKLHYSNEQGILEGQYTMPIAKSTLAQYEVTPAEPHALSPIQGLVQGWAESAAFSYYEAHGELVPEGNEADPEEAARVAWEFTQEITADPQMDTDFARIAGSGCPPAFTHFFTKALAAIRAYKALDHRTTRWAKAQGFLSPEAR